MKYFIGFITSLVVFLAIGLAAVLSGALQREIQKLLEHAIDGLPDAFRLVLVARAIEGMSIEETAELLAIRPETVKSRLHRARTLLKAKLEQDLGSSLTETFPFEGERCARMTSSVLERLKLQ